YKEQLEAVFRMTRAELIEFVKTHPLPANYSPPSAAVPLYYYYGVQKADALGIDVYIEGVRSYWWYYIKKIAVAVANVFVNEPAVQLAPTFSNPMGFKFLLPDSNTPSSGSVRIVPPPEANPYFLEYYNPAETVWFYGVKVIDRLNTVTSATFLYVALNVISLAGLFMFKSPFQKITAFSILAG